MEKIENLFKLNVDQAPPSAASSTSSFASTPSDNDEEEMNNLPCPKSEHNFVDNNNSFTASSSTNNFNIKDEEHAHQATNETNVNALKNDDNDNDNDDKNYISQMDINLLLSNNRNDSLPDSINDLKQLEQDKKAVYSHPLFPLLALLFEKCEAATRSINVFETEKNSSSFNNEIEEFIKHQKALGKPFFTDDSEVDSLMIKAIQVFRIHLLELEKVSDLCKDFCYRYISCLKTKMRSDTLIRGNHDGPNHDHTNKLFNNLKNDIFFPGDQSFFCSSSSSNLSSNSSPVSYLSNSPEPSPSLYLTQKLPQTFNNNLAPFDIDSVSCSKSSSPLSNQQFSVNFDTLFTPLFKSMTKSVAHSKLNISNEQYPNNINFIDDDNEDNSVVHDLSLKNKSKITNESNLIDNNNTGDKKKRKSQTDNINGNTTMKNIEKMAKSTKDGKKTIVDITKTSNVIHSKRGVLPKQATTIMRSWLFQHIVHPYPTEDEKRAIASETNLTLLQVNNWFINARRRILQPMLDSAHNMQAEFFNNAKNTNMEQELDLSVSKVKNGANVSGSRSHTKKLRLNQQMNRFWPQSLANIIQTNDASSQSKF